MGVLSLPYFIPPLPRKNGICSAPPARMTKHTGGGNKENNLIKLKENQK